MSFWKSKSPAEKLQHIIGEKNGGSNALKMVRETVSFYLRHPLPHQEAQLSTKRDLPGWWQLVSECLASPAVWDTDKKAHFFLAPFRILSCAAGLRRGGARWTAARSLGVNRPWLLRIPSQVQSGSLHVSVRTPWLQSHTDMAVVVRSFNVLPKIEKKHWTSSLKTKGWLA